MIGQLISTRPRTLRELAEKTGISIQGVLKHLGSLKKMGLVEERTLRQTKYLAVRKAYSLKWSNLGDFSRGGLMIVNLSKERRGEEPGVAKDMYQELNGMAEELLIQGRRIKDQARRLQRMIDEFSATGSRLKKSIESLNLDPEERLIAETVFTEDTLEGAAAVLSKFYGCANPDQAIRDVVAKVKKAG
jgi:predicted transcriptional regulator